MSSPTIKTIKRLFAVSGNQCAFPDCITPLVVDDTVVAEICHIKARSPDGPRYDPKQDEKDRDAVDNLLLLCPIHHKIIDDDPATYTVERLGQIKAEHEARHRGGLEPSDHLARQLLSLHQLPSPPAHFTGREKELDELITAIEKEGVIISGLRGMGGIGKTALALELAQRLTPHYPDAQIFLDLRGTDPRPLTPEQAMGHVIHAFHPRVQLPASEGELAGTYRSILHGKQVLLVMDNAADRGQVEALLPPTCCFLLVTSRRRFSIAGMRSLNLDTLAPADARCLLLRIAARIGDLADQIAQLCGYLPLALELAASTLAEREDLSPADYCRRLQEAQTRLDLVDASLTLSYDLLSARLQRLWARLAVFAGSFDRPAAAAIWEMEPDPAHDALGDLVRYSLVDWDDETGRYNLHDLARLFAYDKLRQSEDPRPVHRLAAEHLRAKIADPEEGGTPEEILEEVDQWERAEAWEEMARNASALVGSLDRLGYWAEIQARLERALEAVRPHLEAQPKLAAALLEDLGTVAHKQAEWDRAIEMYQQSLETKERVGDVHGMAQTFNNLGLVYADKGEWDRAIEMYQQSLETKERVGDVHGMAQTFNNLGLVYADKGEWDRAIEYYEKDLEISERVGDVHGMAYTEGNLGNLYLAQGELDKAEEIFEQTLNVSRSIGDIHSVGLALNALGRVYQRREDKEQAALYFAQAYLIFSQLGSTDADSAASALVQAFDGAVEAANDYLAQIAEEMQERDL
jgi:tetratricopeptide (TPR) repeat protein